MARHLEKEVLIERRGAVALVEINRPPVNFFDLALIETLLQRMQALDADPECRAIVLAASGKVFCAGADFGSGVDPDQALEVATKLYSRAIGLFEIGTPVVASVQGGAIGGGLGLALAADFRVASEAARFSANFAVLGMHCGFGISTTLPRVVGANAAARMLYTGDRLSGAEAFELGLADSLVAAGEERQAALDLATKIAAGAPRAVQDMRRTLRRGLADDVRATLAHELALQGDHMKTADFLEGVRAASERRTPHFTGK